MTDDALAEAMRSEASIGEQAAEIRGDEAVLSASLFLKLWPLLREPIPSAFIQTVGRTQGKPYVSTGIKSVQVQIDRMNNVLTPIWWWDEAEYDRDGKLCTVTVFVGNRIVEAGGTAIHPEEALLMASGTQIITSRTSRGGVERGSSIGNIHKGSYTNAAKLAFARLGVGHEVYLGATDLDPDVSTELAEDKGEQPDTITRAIAKKLVDRAWAAGVNDNLRLAGSHAAGGRDVGDTDTKAKAIVALESLTFSQADRLEAWLTKKESESS